MQVELPNLFLAEDAEALARAAAARLSRAAEQSEGRFAVCLSGGRTPRRLFELLACPPHLERFPWGRTHWFWADERFVPADHADSNQRMAREAMLARAGVAEACIHAVATEGTTPEQAAMRYAEVLEAFYGADELDPRRPLFDVTLLGLGEDGHTASLFPDTAALDEREAWATAVIGVREQPRITLTLPVLESSREVVFLVSGAEKRDVVRAVGRGADLPASRLRPLGRVSWLLDRAAAPVA